MKCDNTHLDDLVANGPQIH